MKIGNKGSRTNPTTVPIYVVFKNKPKEKEVKKRAGGRHPEYKSPTVIWVKDGSRYMGFLGYLQIFSEHTLNLKNLGSGGGYDMNMSHATATLVMEWID